MDEINKIIDELNLKLENIEHSINIDDCSTEAKHFLEIFSEEEIINTTKYKDLKPLDYNYDESMKDKECKIFLGISQFKNVKKSNNNWVVHINKNYTQYNGGYYNSEINAGIAAFILDKILYKNYSRKNDFTVDEIIKHKDEIIKKLKNIYK